MLYVLGTIFYIIAAFGVGAAILNANEYDPSGLFFAVSLGSAISAAFFGAMCMAADEALSLLRKIAGVETKVPELILEGSELEAPAAGGPQFPTS